MVRSWIMRLLSFLGIFSVLLIMISLFGSSVFWHLDILDQDQIELSKMSSEKETERETEKQKEIEETEVDEFINGRLGKGDPDLNKLPDFGMPTNYLVNSNNDVTTPPPELV